MPLPIYELGVQCWKIAYPYLDVISQACTPTHCQLLIYHPQFNGHIGAHRDNGLLLLTGKLRVPHSEDENSQIHGSAVMCYCVGAPMNFSLLQPPKGMSVFNAKNKNYKRDPSLVINLSHGCLFVLHANDDENYIHTTAFNSEARKHIQKPHLAFMFQLLSKHHEFYCDEVGMNRYAMVDEDFRQLGAKRASAAGSLLYPLTATPVTNIARMPLVDQMEEVPTEITKK